MTFKVTTNYQLLSHDEWMERYIAERAKLGFTRSVSIPDPTPMAPPLGYKPAPSLRDQIREMVLSEKLRLEAESAGAETFEESDDFDVPDLDPTSPYEENFDPVESLRRAREWETQVRAEADRRDRVDFPDRYPPPEPPAPPPPPPTKKGKRQPAAPPADEDDTSDS